MQKTGRTCFLWLWNYREEGEGRHEDKFVNGMSFLALEHSASCSSGLSLVGGLQAEAKWSPVKYAVAWNEQGTGLDDPQSTFQLECSMLLYVSALNKQDSLGPWIKQHHGKTKNADGIPWAKFFLQHTLFKAKPSQRTPSSFPRKLSAMSLGKILFIWEIHKAYFSLCCYLVAPAQLVTIHSLSAVLIRL